MACQQLSGDDVDGDPGVLQSPIRRMVGRSSCRPPASTRWLRRAINMRTAIAGWTGKTWRNRIVSQTFASFCSPSGPGRPAIQAH